MIAGTVTELVPERGLAQGMKANFIVAEEFKLFLRNLKWTGGLNSPNEGRIQRRVAGGLKNPDTTHASIRVQYHFHQRIPYILADIWNLPVFLYRLLN